MRRTPAMMAYVNGQYDRSQSDNDTPEVPTFEAWCLRYHYAVNDYAKPIYDAYVNGWNEPKGEGS